MDKSRLWMYLFLATLTLCVALSLLLVQAKMKSEYLREKSFVVEYKGKYNDLKKEHIEICRQFSFDLETLMKNEKDLRRYWPVYKDMSKEDFDEAIRRKIVKLKVNIENLEKED